MLPPSRFKMPRRNFCLLVHTAFEKVYDHTDHVPCCGCPVVGKAEAARKENGGSAFSSSKFIFRDPQEETGAEIVW